jgi:nitric oxide reductase subunit B
VDGRRESTGSSRRCPSASFRQRPAAVHARRHRDRAPGLAKLGGQQLGSIWGHGALVAPDWSADWLHRETEAWMGLRASHAFGRSLATLDAGDRAKLQAQLAAGHPPQRLRRRDRHAHWYPTSARRRSAWWPRTTRACSPTTRPPTRCGETYAMRDDTVDTTEHRRALTGFFFWTSWAAANRPPRREP